MISHLLTTFHQVHAAAAAKRQRATRRPPRLREGPPHAAALAGHNRWRGRDAPGGRRALPHADDAAPWRSWRALPKLSAPLPTHLAFARSGAFAQLRPQTTLGAAQRDYAAGIPSSYELRGAVDADGSASAANGTYRRFAWHLEQNGDGSAAYFCPLYTDGTRALLHANQESQASGRTYQEHASFWAARPRVEGGAGPLRRPSALASEDRAGHTCCNLRGGLML